MEHHSGRPMSVKPSRGSRWELGLFPVRLGATDTKSAQLRFMADTICMMTDKTEVDDASSS